MSVEGSINGERQKMEVGVSILSGLKALADGRTRQLTIAC